MKEYSKDQEHLLERVAKLETDMDNANITINVLGWSIIVLVIILGMYAHLH